ncbi:MAG: hypothetical protein FWG64_03125 [Firmicutes bacterium]|nr:hypothetical protein [Bacillota bacterium]
MRIGSVGTDNYQDMLKIFSDSQRQRIAGLRERSRTEAGKWDASLAKWPLARNPFGRSMTTVEFDDIMSALDPNWIRGMGRGENSPPPREIALSEDMIQGVQDMVRFHFSQNFGGSRNSVKFGDEFGMLSRSFVREFAEQDRLDASFSIGMTWRREFDRITDAVRDAVPGWTWGQHVPSNILQSILNGGGTVDTTA